MRLSPAKRARRQRGMALITSLLLLLVVTILAVSMFRSFGIEGKIAGNVREKQRALMAAEDAQQFAEWWLSQANTATLKGAPCSGMLNANDGEVQVCTNTLPAYLAPTNTPIASVGSWPYWTTYTPKNLNVQANTANNYAKAPGFYISYMGLQAGTGDLLYQIDAVGYGADANTVAVVESTFAVKQGAPKYDYNPEYPPMVEFSQ